MWVGTTAVKIVAKNIIRKHTYLYICFNHLNLQINLVFQRCPTQFLKTNQKNIWVDICCHFDSSGWLKHTSASRHISGQVS
jgi:hypothetical protein